MGDLTLICWIMLQTGKCNSTVQPWAIDTRSITLHRAFWISRRPHHGYSLQRYSQSYKWFRIYFWLQYRYFKYGGRIVNGFSYARYTRFIFTQRPVIDANTLRKNEYYDFRIVSVEQEFDREVSDLQKVETKRWPDRVSCDFVFWSANITILLRNAINFVLKIHSLFLKAQRNRLRWFTNFKISGFG